MDAAGNSSQVESNMEIVRFLCLVPLRRMDFRLNLNPKVTCSDASQHGGGVCVATSLTTYGEKVALGEERRDMVAGGGQRILSNWAIRRHRVPAGRLGSVGL